MAPKTITQLNAPTYADPPDSNTIPGLRISRAIAAPIVVVLIQSNNADFQTKNKELDRPQMIHICVSSRDNASGLVTLEPSVRASSSFSPEISSNSVLIFALARDKIVASAKGICFT